MRPNKDMTQYQPIDLADQPKGKYLLRFQYGDGPSTVLWVDRLDDSLVGIAAYRGDVQVAAFSHNCQWFVLAADLVETMTNAEAIDRIYTDAVASQDTAARYRKMYEYRQGQMGTPPPSPKPSFLDDDDLRRLLGGEGAE